MALIGIIADKTCNVDTYSLSEVHYVLRADCSYITIEFAVTASDDVNCFILCIHGSIETEPVKKVNNKLSYHNLFVSSDCHIKPSNGIYDFRDTWNIEAITNQCYEG